MTFEECVDVILRFEGGYCNNILDPGGETNFGICKRSYPDLNIKDLTKDEAAEVYRRDFWEKLGIAAVPESLRLIFFDCAVNQGPARARTFLTIAMKDPNPVKAFARARFEHYMSLPGWKEFSKGWARRLFEITLMSLP